MKTLFKTMKDTKQAIAKRNWFQEKTGLKWDYYSTGDGMRFTPIATVNTPLDAVASELLYHYLTTEYKGFVKLSEESNLTLPQVVSGAWTLVKANEVLFTVNRMGNLYAIRKKHSYEK